MLDTLKATRQIVIKHIMQEVCAGNVEINAGLRLITAFDEEYRLANDSIERFQKVCFQITDNRTVVMGP